MLSPDQSDYVAAHFNVYEHNWPFYEELLGESLLLNDILSYCDGSGLYLASFALKEPGFIFDPKRIVEYADQAIEYFSGSKIAFINIWGQFNDLPTNFKSMNGQELYLSKQSDYYVDMFDSIFDINDFDSRKSRSANRRIRTLTRKNIQTNIRRCSSFDHDHLHLIERWMKTHNVSIVHREFFYALRSYIKKDNVYLCEARSNEALVGLSIIATVGNERMVILNSFPMRGNGLRAGDALFAEAISFARKNSVRWIHRGYSATDSLLKAKESWGSMARSRPYREAFYVINSEAAEMIKDDRFLWRLRLSTE
jgi:hypothetical protein